MLVINSNNQQDTTNYMLADPGYPDVESILMRGGPEVVFYRTINGNTGITGQGINDSPVIDTIGTEPINYYCPKFYKSGLRQGNTIRTPYTYTNSMDVMPGFGCVINASGTVRKFTINGDTGYRIAVKGLKSGQTIGEHIFAPLLFYSNYYDGLTGSVSITFGLLHSDGTKTQIHSSPLSYAGGAPYQSGKLVGTTASGTTVWGIYSTSLWTLKYDGVGQVAQDGDILYADVIMTGMEQYYGNSNSGGIGVSGLLYGQTNNNNLRDINGFRPFQVSIRNS